MGNLWIDGLTFPCYKKKWRLFIPDFRATLMRDKLSDKTLTEDINLVASFVLLLIVFSIIIAVVLVSTAVSLSGKISNVQTQLNNQAPIYGAFYNNVTQTITPFGARQLVNYTYTIVTTLGVKNDGGIITLEESGVYQVSWIMNVGSLTETILASFVATILNGNTSSIIPFQPSLSQIRKINNGGSSLAGIITIKTTNPSQQIGLYVQLSEMLATPIITNTEISIVKIN
jgi:hypothetical protein